MPERSQSSSLLWIPTSSCWRKRSGCSKQCPGTGRRGSTCSHRSNRSNKRTSAGPERHSRLRRAPELRAGRAISEFGSGTWSHPFRVRMGRRRPCKFENITKSSSSVGLPAPWGAGREVPRKRPWGELLVRLRDGSLLREAEAALCLGLKASLPTFDVRQYLVGAFAQSSRHLDRFQAQVPSILDNDVP